MEGLELKTGKIQEGFTNRFRFYRIKLGQSLLLVLEILVAADIVRTVALEPNFANLGSLGLLVVEIEGRWPWQTERRPDASKDGDFL